ncbi:MAG: hypothetical protein OER88_00955 [Planctomycetota bacterium]|nr:hypothetical protein [Planctomycetota bacterium]
MRILCPFCSRTVADRRLENCEFCGAEIPSELLYTPAQIAAREALDREAARTITAPHQAS